MNKYRLLSILLFLGFTLTVVQCKKNKTLETNGDMSCEYNGTQWEASQVFAWATTRPDTIDRIEINKSNLDKGALFEEIKIINLRKTLSIQRFQHLWVYSSNNTDSLSAFYKTIDYDAFCDGYEIWDADSLNNWVQITQENNDYSEIWGKFSATFIKVFSCSTAPDTVRIRNANFHIWKVKKN